MTDTDIAALVEWLRHKGPHIKCAEAADTIATLQAEIERLREAYDGFKVAYRHDSERIDRLIGDNEELREAWAVISRRLLDARIAALEEAAQVADKEANATGNTPYYELAAAIRALAGDTAVIKSAVADLAGGLT